MTPFEELSKRRRLYVDAARDNGFEEGLRKLLSNLYPDNAHFIYELLQNAEDAGAREVDFDLRPDGLWVEHDGERLFDLRDIDSITGIGQSTKADDATSIGKFGVGFKAVFAYTQTPEIHSGNYSFAIHDLFVPTFIPTDVAHAGRTRFWFPFDRPDKPAVDAVREVASALREISRTTLLFLNSIQLISCSLPNGDERLLERRVIDHDVVAIESSDEDDGPAYWYRIGGAVEVGGKPLRVAAAFALQAHESKPREATSYSVKPIEGQVFIYFPAINETSGLKFHIHAPFASTVARDSVRDDPGNESLVQGIADLISGALPAMRDKGLIADGLLGALPNDKDDLPVRYALVRRQVMAPFNEKSLTPTLDGKHLPARDLFRSDPIVRSAMSLSDANFIRGLCVHGDETASSGWLQDGKGRAGAFLDSLEAQDFGRDELSEALRTIASIYDEIRNFGHDDVDVSDGSQLVSWHNWICGKSDNWLSNFYVTLEALAPRTRTFPGRFHDRVGEEFARTLSAAPLIRVQDGEQFRHVSGPEAYLPTAPGLHADRLVIDSLAVFSITENADDQDLSQELSAFYGRAQVKHWDAATRLDARFDKYDQEPAVVTEQHLDDLRTLKDLIEKKAVASATYRNRPILVALRKDGSAYWAAPQAVYMDEPFVSTGLTSLYQSERFNGVPAGRLTADYFGETTEVASLAKELNAISGLQIARVAIWNNPKFEASWRYDGRENKNMIARDWVILNFRAVIATNNSALLRSLWQLVASADATPAEAIYRSNGTSSVRRISSRLVQDLTTEPWILDRDGNLRLPTDMTAAELPTGIAIPQNAVLLELAGFGRAAEIDETLRSDDENHAQALGFESADIARAIAEAFTESPNEVMEWLQARKMRSLPDSPSAAPEQRAQRVAEVSINAPRREYDNRVRSIFVQVPGHRSASRGYLTRMYTNDTGVMICQICSSAMPFKVSNSYYFEAVQFVRDSTRDLPENRLALCPTCAAKYRHARNTSLEDLRDDLLTQTVGSKGSITVDLTLAGLTAKLRFGGKHAIDLQAALSATDGEPIDDDELENIQ